MAFEGFLKVILKIQSFQMQYGKWEMKVREQEEIFVVPRKETSLN